MIPPSEVHVAKIVGRPTILSLARVGVGWNHGIARVGVGWCHGIARVGVGWCHGIARVGVGWCHGIARSAGLMPGGRDAGGGADTTGRSEKKELSVQPMSALHRL